MADKLAKERLERFAQLKASRTSTFDSGWQELGNYFLPQLSNANTQKLAGTTSGWTDRIYDTTAIQAAQVLRSGQRNWLTPSSEPWAAFEPPEYLSGEGKGENKDEAAQWLSMATDVTMRELARSNFYAMVNLDYLQIAVFGTGMIFCDEGKRNTLNFRQFKPWTFTIEENDEGIVDSVNREFELTTRQAVQWFGVDAVGEKIRTAWEKTSQHTRKWKFVHSVFPREDSKRLSKRKDGPNKPVASVYIAVEDIAVVQESGYEEMPYLCSRFDMWGTDVPWGYSPAYLCLPDVRQINYVQQYRDALAELKAYPRFFTPDSLDGDVDLRAGGATVINADDMARGVMPREWMTVGDDRAAQENIDRKVDAINKAFYVNMFTMLEQLSDKKMTAYEISQRIGEKLEQFTPIFDRRINEFLNPLMRRVFGILYRAGKFGQAPASLMVDNGSGVQALALPEIAITSRISMALKALQNTGITNMLGVLEPLAQNRPDVMDNVDLDTMMRDMARNFGVPPDLLRPIKNVNEIRAQRTQAQQAQQAMQIAQGAAKAAKDLGHAPKAMQDSASEAMEGAMGGG